MGRKRQFTDRERKERARISEKRSRAKNHELYYREHVEWRNRNIEHARAYAKKYARSWRAKQPSAIAAATRRERIVKNPELYTLERREKESKRVCKWAKANPIKARNIVALRKARKLNATIGDPSVVLRWETAWRAEPRVRCYWCSARMSPRHCHSDHITPLAKGGAHAIENLCIACQPCNNRKNARLLFDWNASLSEPVLL